METKRLILSVAMMMVIVAGWELFATHLYKMYPSLNATAPATTQPDAITPAAAASTGSTTSPSTMPVAGGPPPAGLHALAVGASGGHMVGSDQHVDGTYAEALNTDANGASLSSVILNNFYETAEHKDLYKFQTPLGGVADDSAALATRSVSINGTKIDLSGQQWKQTASDRSSVTYTAVVQNGATPALQIDKTYTVFPSKSPDQSGGYETLVHEQFHNLTAKSMVLRTVTNGPTPPPRESDRQEDRQLIAGYDDGLKEVAIAHAFLGEFTDSKPTKDFVSADNRPLLWVGTGSAYFNAVVRPEATASEPLIPLAKAEGVAVNPSAPADERLVHLTLETADFTVAPGATSGLNLRVFFGPKQRDLLKNAYYSAFPMAYDETLIYKGGWCGFATLPWLITGLYYILAGFHFIFRDWGLAIIGLVCLVRLCLHPITKRSQINMMSMGKMGPEIERLKKKYGDNKDELNKAMMGIYKEQGIAPVLGCLPMFLQMPIWIALWSALQSTFDLRQATFLRFGSLHLSWIKDLSHPDYLVHFNQAVPLVFGWTLHGINVLPILMAGVYFMQQKMQPVPPNQTPEQIQQRKMMQYMSLLFPIFLYPAPSGLNLYILTSTTIGIFESKIVRDHIKARDEAEKSGRIIVDATPTRASKRNTRDAEARAKAEPAKRGWWAELQEKAEQIRRDAGKR